MKEDMASQIVDFDKMGDYNPYANKSVSPDKVMKQVNTEFESFFYKRDYNLKNFNFYL